jgi:hypothetical protein
MCSSPDSVRSRDGADKRTLVDNKVVIRMERAAPLNHLDSELKPAGEKIRSEEERRGILHV